MRKAQNQKKNSQKLLFVMDDGIELDFQATEKEVKQIMGKIQKLGQGFFRISINKEEHLLINTSKIKLMRYTK